MELPTLFSPSGLSAALVVSLLSVGVLVALFFYLNRYTRRNYFTVWGAAWLFYALWLMLKLTLPSAANHSFGPFVRQLCIETSAVFLLWGSFRFIGLETPQRLMGLFLGFLAVWSYVAPYISSNVLVTEVPCFALIGLASATAGVSFRSFRQHRRYVGASLLAVGFILWGLYLVLYPLAQRNPGHAALALFFSASVQLFIAVSMIILVLEEVRYTNDAFIEEIQSVRAEKELLQARMQTSEQQLRTLYADASLKSEMQRAYEELRQTHHTVVEQERLSVLGQIASGMAHDINNALTPLIGFSELLLSSQHQVPERLHGALKSIRASGLNIADIVERVRRFYRRRTEDDILECVRLNAVVDEVAQAVRHRWTAEPGAAPARLEIELDLDLELPDVPGNSVELREAIHQLIANAEDALPQGGRIVIATRRGASREGEPATHAILEVRDHGVGMDEQTRRRCLEPFFSTKKPRHSGLGLSMVHGTVQRHLGAMQIEAAPGTGTHVRLLLPVQSLPQAASRADGPTEPAAPLRILCIDDEPLVRMLLKDLLQMFGHQAEIADSAAQGFESFANAEAAGQPFDVVFTDLGMPDIDGREVVRRLRQRSPGTCLVMLTGWATLLDSTDPVLHQIDALLQKPLSMAQLRAVLLRVSGARHASGGANADLHLVHAREAAGCTLVTPHSGAPGAPPPTA